MSLALRLAERGRYTVSPNPQVGCVLVRDGQIVGQGWHMRAGEAHAEVVALNEAAELAAGATAYVTLEPCCHQGRTPPCTEALIRAGVSRVVFASSDPNPQVAGRGASQLQEAGVTVDSGLLADVASNLNKGFFQRMRTRRPFVRSKIAVSLDGRTALASGESKWITGAAARADVQRLRARSCAVMTGIGTVLSDDPALNVRDDNLGEVRQPLRIILDSHFQTPLKARTLGLQGQVLICGLQGDASVEKLKAVGADIVTLPEVNARVDLDGLLGVLAEKEINELLVEAGPVLNGALIRKNLIDELIVYTAANVLGDKGRGMFELPALGRMEDRVEMLLTDVRRVGDDVRTTYRRKTLEI